MALMGRMEDVQTSQRRKASTAMTCALLMRLLCCKITPMRTASNGNRDKVRCARIWQTTHTAVHETHTIQACTEEAAQESRLVSISILKAASTSMSSCLWMSSRCVALTQIRPSSEKSVITCGILLSVAAQPPSPTTRNCGSEHSWPRSLKYASLNPSSCKGPGEAANTEWRFH